MMNPHCPINRHVSEFRKRYSDLDERLFHAVVANDQQSVTQLIRAGAKVDPKYRYGISLLPGTPLFTSVYHG